MLVGIAMFLFKGITPDTSMVQIIVMHSVLMVGLMFVMTAQTYGLNQLTPDLYPHGTALFNTLQQVAGAIGTAIFISKMSSGTTKYMESSANPLDPVEVKRFNFRIPRCIYTWASLYNCCVYHIVIFKRREKGSKGSEGFTERTLRFI